MNLLLDTHILLWFALLSAELTPARRALIEDERNTIYFSVISLWEMVIKRSLGKPDFTADASVLRDLFLSQGFIEILFKAEHALAVGLLPRHHGDPFDRALLAQATAEGLTLVTADADLSRYSGAVLKV